MQNRDDGQRVKIETALRDALASQSGVRLKIMGNNNGQFGRSGFAALQTRRVAPWRSMVMRR